MPPWQLILDWKICGTHLFAGVVAGEGIPYERSPVTFPWRQVAGESMPPWQLILDWKICGTHLFAGIVAGEGIPYERSPVTFPWRQVAGESDESVMSQS
nr:hypothetical protein [Tanacetum cinerariifolium]